MQLSRKFYGISYSGLHSLSTIPSAAFQVLSSKKIVCHACSSLLFPPGRRPILVELKLHHATTNSAYAFVRSAPSHEVRGIPITKARSILSIGLLSTRQVIADENEVKGRNEPRTTTVTSTVSQRFSLFQSREGVPLELFEAILASQAWEKLTQGWGAPDASWVGSLLR